MILMWMKVFETKDDEVLLDFLKDVSRTDLLLEFLDWNLLCFITDEIGRRISFVVAIFDDFDKTDDRVSSNVSENVLRKCYLAYETDFKFINEDLVLVKSIWLNNPIRFVNYTYVLSIKLIRNSCFVDRFSKVMLDIELKY